MKRFAFLVLAAALCAPCNAGFNSGSVGGPEGFFAAKPSGGGATNFLLINTGSALLVNTGSKFLIQ